MNSRTIHSLRQQGATLIEALVALGVLAVGVLGMLGIQLKSVADNQNATQRLIATRLADDLFERMKANAGGMDSIKAYAMGVNKWPTSNPTPSDSQLCDKNLCTPGNQAAFDLWQWRKRVASMLPSGQATTFISPSDPRQLGVMVAWSTRKTDAARTPAGGEDTAKTKARYGWLDVDVANGASCDPDMICHVAFSQP